MTRARPDKLTPMDARREAFDTVLAPVEPAYDILGPRDIRAPVVIASPHSGRLYPRDMMAASGLDPAAIRRSEDAYVDRLAGSGAAFGLPVLQARYARAYVDVNREPYELDAGMFDGEIPAFARARTARVAAGLGAIARVVGEGQEIYLRKLTFEEARRRIEAVHRPYHRALAGLIATAQARFGLCALFDLHSMPSAAGMAAARGGRPADVVLGDRFGASCAPAVTRLVERALEEMGYTVGRNAPYAGGYTTEFYGRPGRRVHALQVEINRALYLDEATLEPGPGYGALAADLEQLFRKLSETDWRTMV